jgi:hypothetical protein
MNTGVLWLGGQVATREADVERCVSIGAGQGKCLRRGKAPARALSTRGVPGLAMPVHPIGLHGT